MFGLADPRKHYFRTAVDAELRSRSQSRGVQRPTNECGPTLAPSTPPATEDWTYHFRFMVGPPATHSNSEQWAESRSA